MGRILFIVEGETEETFVDELLGPHLLKFGHVCSARLLGNSPSRSKRGGITNWDSAGRDIERHLRGDQSAYVTTMVDFYAMPAGGSNGWPGRMDANDLSTIPSKASRVQSAIFENMAGRFDPDYNLTRFIPFVLMHEFEALLFSDIPKFAEGIGQRSLEADLLGIRREFETPEHINDSPMTAPNKRISQLYPGYQKVLHGNLAALEIGLGVMRTECPMFGAWIDRLEKLP